MKTKKPRKPSRSKYIEMESHIECNIVIENLKQEKISLKEEIFRLGIIAKKYESWTEELLEKIRYDPTVDDLKLRLQIVEKDNLLQRTLVTDLKRESDRIKIRLPWYKKLMG